MVVPSAINKPATITVPAGAQPKKLLSQSVITGKGLKTATGDTVSVTYTGINWRTKKVFDSSSKQGKPAAFQLTSTSIIPGFYKGLVGRTVGSRVVLIIPPADGYGTKGSTEVGIKGTDTIAFVVDILAIIPQQQQAAAASGG